MLLVKPALPSLDILAAARARYDVPDRRLPGQRRVRLHRGRRAARLARPPARPDRVHHLDPARRRGLRDHATPPRTSRPGRGRPADDRSCHHATSATGGRQAALRARAADLFPGGVNSPVRAFRSVGRPPLILDAGRGPRVRDADGRWYLDYIGSWGPAILGHAAPAVDRGGPRGRPGRVRARAPPARARWSWASGSGRRCRRWSGCASCPRAPRRS